MLKNLIRLIIMSALIGGTNYFINSNIVNVGLLSDEVDLVSVHKIKSPIIIVDARTDKEFSEGHIVGAVNLSEEKFTTHIDSFLDLWTPDANVVIYCNSKACNSSRNVLARLRVEYGIKNVFVLKDDWRKWKSSK